MAKSTRHIGIYSNSPEEISNRLFAGAQSYMKEVGGFIARDYCPKERAGLDSVYHPPWKGQVDAVLIGIGRDDGKSDKDMADWVLSGGVPAVMTGADWDDPRIPRFHVDSHSLAELAAEHLVECGCRSFLYVGYALSSGSPQRGKALEESLGQRGKELAQYSIRYKCLGASADLPFLKAEKPLIAQLRKMNKPLGIWTLNDRFTVALSLLCQDLALAIPQAVKILGVDDISLARSDQWALSSIRTPGEQVARLAMRALHRLLDCRSVPCAPTSLLATELHARKSTLGKTPIQVGIADACDYIAKHACAGLTLEHLAQVIGVSRRTCELQFHALVGHSPRDEIQRVRLERSKELLSETLFSVSRIASMIGFAETAAFSKFFRKETGISPSDFREGKNKSTKNRR